MGQKRSFWAVFSSPKLVPVMPILCRMSMAWAADPRAPGRTSWERRIAAGRGSMPGTCGAGTHPKCGVGDGACDAFFCNEWGGFCICPATSADQGCCREHGASQGKEDRSPTFHWPVGDLAASNIFFRPSIPDMASTFLRQSPTSTGRSCREGWGHGLQRHVTGWPAVPCCATLLHRALSKQHGQGSCPVANALSLGASSSVYPCAWS